MKHQNIMPFSKMIATTSIIIIFTILIDVMMIKNHQKLFDFSIFNGNDDTETETDEENDEENDDIDDIIESTYDEI